MLDYEKGLNPYYGLLDIALKYDIVKKVSTRIEFPDGRKAYEKSVYKEPEKYFTDEIMWDIEKRVAEEFKYGSTKKDVTDEQNEEQV